MQKPILTLTSKDFYTGKSTGYHVDRGGLWGDACGINVFTDPDNNTVEAGLLQTSPTPTDISSTIAGNPTDYAVDGTDMWFVTSGGDIAKIDLSSPASACTVVETSITNMGTGCEMFQPDGGSKHLIYGYSNTKIARHDLTTTSTDVLTGLNSTTVRPIRKFKDRLYFGNVDKLGFVIDDGAAGFDGGGNTLDLPADKLIMALEDDGTFLVIAATTNTSFTQNVHGDTRVYFWDTNVNSWNREWVIPDTYVYAMQRVGDRIYALGARGLWMFNYQTRPVKLRDITGDSTLGSYHGAMSVLNNAVLWGGNGNSEVHSYGEMLQGIGVREVLHCPYAYPTNNARTTMVAADTRTGFMFTGALTNKLYSWNLASGGATGVSAKSVYIPFSQTYEIDRIEFILGDVMASGDKLDVDVQGDETAGENTDGSTWGTLSFATHGAVKRRSLKGHLTTQNLKLILTFAGGNVKIKTINVYGKPKNTQ